jgi:Leucine-rich repeat (LRR) protein
MPLSIQELSKLEFLDMSQNALTGTVPVSLGNMKALTNIRLGGNQFAPSGIPPVFFTILNLKELSMPMTNLSGPIPAWVPLMDRLEYLDLSGNSLTGSIPDGIFGMPNLYTLILRTNKINSLLIPASSPTSRLGKFTSIRHICCRNYVTLF